MGTNYYVASNICECCNRYDKEYHIGKSSHGWAFSFHGYKSQQLVSWVTWKEFLKDKSIVDEYGTPVDYDSFVKMIETEKAPNHIRENGKPNLVHNIEGRKANERGYSFFNSKYDWDDELGYSFSSNEFL